MKTLWEHGKKSNQTVCYPLTNPQIKFQISIKLCTAKFQEDSDKNKDIWHFLPISNKLI